MERASKQRSGNLFLAAQHQLRQPLNAISLLIGELRDAADGRDRAAIVEDMRYALQLSNAWLDSLTDLEKAEQGHLELRVQAVPLQQIFTRLGEDFATRFAEQGIAFRVVDTSAVVRADPAFLRRLLMLLLDNAAKFAGEGKVLLGCRRAGERLRVEVWDCGPGIAEEDKTRIFEAFHRLENEVRPRERGLGLGLTYARRLAEIAGDDLTVFSRPGSGACFALTLQRAASGEGPVTLSPEAAGDDSEFVSYDAIVAGTAEGPSPAVMPVDPLSGATVLLLAGDDAQALSESLEGWGAKVSVTTRDRLGDELQAGPDLVLADSADLDSTAGRKLMTPAADGPAVIVLVDRQADAGASAAPAGARIHLLKRPVRPAQLRSLCHFALTHR